jgi:YtkA-like protein
VSTRASHRLWVWLAAAILSVIGVVAVLGATASPDPRATLFSQLHRPAVAAPASAPTAAPQIRARHGHAILTLAGRAYIMDVSPNLASARDRLALAVTAGGRPIAGATVTVAFSMPAMNMWRAFSVRLTPTARGAYVGTLPFVGMPGQWRLDVRVALPGHAPVAFAAADVLGS